MWWGRRLSVLCKIFLALYSQKGCSTCGEEQNGKSEFQTATSWGRGHAMNSGSQNDFKFRNYFIVVWWIIYVWQSAQILNVQLNKFLKSEYTHALSSQIRKQNIFRSEKRPSFPANTPFPLQNRHSSDIHHHRLAISFAWFELHVNRIFLLGLHSSTAPSMRLMQVVVCGCSYFSLSRCAQALCVCSSVQVYVPVCLWRS